MYMDSDAAYIDKILQYLVLSISKACTVFLRFVQILVAILFRHTRGENLWQRAYTYKDIYAGPVHCEDT
jgi:hypothetical protein